MRTEILLTLALLMSTTASGAPQTAPAPARPAQTAPAPRPAPKPAAPAARSGMAITVTTPQGSTLAGVHVEVLGQSDRSGDTSGSGQINFTAMQAGTYRLRFTGDSTIAFEKELTLRAGQIADVDITLNPAPEAPEPPPPPPPPPAPVATTAAVGPAGQPRALSIVDLIEKEIIPNNQPRKDTLVSCSGNTRTTLVQLNQDQPQRLYDTAEVNYYVVAGEGALRLDGRDTNLAAGSFASIPRGQAHGIVRRGRRPLILVATVSGSPCEEAR
jgi:mannose-6-phosphate isomerase-like protein (cupin superfamily)